MPFDEERTGGGGGGDDPRHEMVDEIATTTVDTMDTLLKMTGTCGMCVARVVAVRLLVSVANTRMHRRHCSVDDVMKLFDDEAMQMRRFVKEAMLEKERENRASRH